LIATGAHYIGEFFHRLTKFELWARRITGGIFVAVGVYYVLVYVFNVSI